MNISKNKILIVFLLLISIVSLTGCKHKYDNTYEIDIKDIFNMEEDSYLIYFYMDNCPYCEGCFKTIKKYLDKNDTNELKLYICNLSKEDNSLIKREYVKEDGQGKTKTYFVDGVTNYSDLYISGAPSVIKVSKKVSSFVVSGRTDVREYFNNLI